MTQKPMKPADTLMISFGLLLIMITLVFYNRIESAGHLLVIYTSIVIFQLILVQISEMNRFLSASRHIIFPVLCVMIIFDTLGLIVHNINPQDIDYLLIRFDYQLFGCYPTVYLERFSPPFFVDILQIAYSTYYFMPIALGILLKAQGKHEGFDKYLFFVLLCFYLSFVGYMIFPALGPRYAIEHLQTQGLNGSMVTQTIQDILNMLEGVKRDAFPSGHTAIALVVLFFAFKYARRFAYILVTPVVLLICATVFCRYHYVVDLIGGVILAVVSLALGELYYKRLGGRGNGSST
jgi:membrane-associated phospholipid phosphatase